jgi:class 3 adenylate cyclase
MVSQKECRETVANFFSGDYSITEGRVIPEVSDLHFAKEGKEMELAMMFIDIRESTKIVDGFRRTTAAKMYKSFLWGVAKIARMNDGELRSFNGDGVLLAFIGDSKRTNAVKAAMQMSWFCKNILKPRLEGYFQNNNQLADLEFNYGIGIDVGNVLVVRAGIRGDNNNDLVWVGNATNYAVKLSSITDDGYNIFISKDVFDKLHKSSKYGGEDERLMWESRTWKGMNIYRSNWWWEIN